MCSDCEHGRHWLQKAEKVQSNIYLRGRISKTLTLGQISAFQILHLVNTEHSEQCNEQSVSHTKASADKKF
jgi:hypothetical protein